MRHLQLYLFEGKEEQNGVNCNVVEKDWRRIRDLLVKFLSTYDVPLNRFLR